ncbi:helix-turn-helix domain-containing protein [Methylobacterium sp. J-026]|uniref:helix-turn-helix domain-containing protein n=1 Tax=Methylobacterium sp. J-026 TaxID=2836624 RepID=UPI001FB99A1A|nr:helix-turn-helix domain-containing protein [Methylobacterium sp. J-026]MCJ2137351.1 helix-turn-helix domain-containing protein [Methylobacterium sp. J-026]
MPDDFLYVKQNMYRGQKMNDAQFRSARAILKLGVREMGELVGVSHFTVGRIEAGEPVKPATIEKVRLALEAAGIEFIPENGGGPGVRDNRKALSRQRVEP